MPKAVTAIDITSEGKRLFIASDKLYLMTLSDQSYTSIESLRMPATDIAADRSGVFGASIRGKAITYYNLNSGKATLTFDAPAEAYAISINNAAQSVCVGGKDGVVRCYSIYGGELLKEYNAKIGEIRDLAVSSNSMIVGGSNGAALIRGDGTVVELARHTDAVNAVSSTPDGKFAVSGGDDTVPVMWELASVRAENSPVNPPMPITAVLVDPYFRYIATAGRIIGDMGGMLNIQYTSKKSEVRNVYPFRDATLTMTPNGYVDGVGLFGKYITYTEGAKVYKFNDVAPTVHQPLRMGYAMPMPKITNAPTAVQTAKPITVDTTPPIISTNERGFQAVTDDEIRTISGTITDESGVAWAKVDGRPFPLKAGGVYSIEVTVPKSGKRIVISAADSYGNATERVITLSSDQQNDGKNRKVALLIGINRYKYLTALKTPEYDVRALSEVLSNNYGYEISTLIGSAATRDAIMGELNRFRRTLTTGDKLIIYYAGHGQLDKDTKEAYWQPYDALTDDDTAWIPTSQLAKNLVAYDASDILVIADSCYSGALSYKPTMSNDVRMFIASGGEEPVADGGKDGHSIFSNALLSALNGDITADTLFQNVAKEMAGKAKQRPTYLKLSGEEFRF
jgi:hypothetical protein